jgi:hypothetical protein
MLWRVLIELTGSDGSVRVEEVYAGSCILAPDTTATVGLTLAVGKDVLAGLQSSSGRKPRITANVAGDAHGAARSAPSRIGVPGD